MKRILTSYAVNLLYGVVGVALLFLGGLMLQLCSVTGVSPVPGWFLVVLGLILLASLVFKALKSLGWV
jgi:hypothetical protein